MLCYAMLRFASVDGLLLSEGVYHLVVQNQRSLNHEDNGGMVCSGMVCTVLI